MKFFNNILARKNFFKGSLVLGITATLGYVLAVFRDRILAQQFGASRTLDAYNAAFTVPDLILNIFVAGALTAAFIPIFTEIKDRREERQDFTNTALSGSLTAVIFCGIIALILARPISHLVAPGFDGSARDIYVNLLRLLLLSPIIFAISNTLGSILVSEEKFFWYGVSPVFYNLGTILGTIFLAPKIGIYGTAIGALGGAVLHLISRVYGLRNFDLNFRFTIKFDDYYKRFLRLMAPKMIGHPVEQLTFLGFTAIASTLGMGSIAVLGFANKFQSVLINLIGMTVALTAFPVLARMTTENNQKGFSKEIKFTLGLILSVSSAAALVLFFIRQPLINIILGGGKFDDVAVSATAAVLGFLALSVPTESLNHLIARGFYSLKNSSIPVAANVFGLIIAVTLGYVLAKPMGYGIPGLALGYFAGSFVKVVILVFLLRRLSRKYFRPEDKTIEAEIAASHEALAGK